MQMQQDQVFTLMQSMRHEIDKWYATSQEEIDALKSQMSAKIDVARRALESQSVNAGHGAHPVPTRANPHGVVGTPKKMNTEELAEGDWNILRREPYTPPPQGAAGDFPSPTASPQTTDKMPLETLLAKIASTSNSDATVAPLNFDSFYEQLTKEASRGNSPVNREQHWDPPSLGGGSGFGPGKQMQSIPIDTLQQLSKTQRMTVDLALSRSENGRPTVRYTGTPTEGPYAEASTPCQVLVEFKRQRVLQFDSRFFASPGEYVVVGGDRGEDVGLVIYSWFEGASGFQGVGLKGSSLTKYINVGSGNVLRVATPLEISQLHGIQPELERRAVDVCQQRVVEHGLPMVIVDAEYQFDKKKLTFYYEAQQRLDFRELVRDLFKTFRARIWMEMTNAN